jgi:hypothetical protein
MFHNSIQDIDFVSRRAERIAPRIKDDLLYNFKIKLDLTEKAIKYNKNPSKYVRTSYNAIFDRLENMNRDFEIQKQNMSTKLTEILKNVYETKNLVDSMSIQKDTEDFCRFINKGKVECLEALARDEVLAHRIEGLTDVERRIVSQPYPPSSIEHIPPPPEPEGLDMGGKAAKKYRKRVTRKHHRKTHKSKKRH